MKAKTKTQTETSNGIKPDVTRCFGQYEARGNGLYYNGKYLHKYDSDDEAILAAKRWDARHKRANKNSG